MSFRGRGAPRGGRGGFGDRGGRGGGFGGARGMSAQSFRPECFNRMKRF